MDQKAIIAEIERRAHARGVTIGAACKRAKIAHSTFYRWKTGAGAPYDKLMAVSSAIDHIAKERAA